MTKLNRSDLLSLEAYAEQRPGYRAEVMTHKKNRQVSLGPNATLYFEDRITMQYQIQEILRIEKIFEAGAIDEELAAYNPLIPDGANWKATFMIEYADEQERRTALGLLIGIERRVWVRVGNPGEKTHEKVWPIANEDLERETADKTSAVHFLRFELSAAMVESVKAGAEIHIGVEHPRYTHTTGPLAAAVAKSLAGDLDTLH